MEAREPTDVIIHPVQGPGRAASNPDETNTPALRSAAAGWLFRFGGDGLANVRFPAQTFD